MNWNCLCSLSLLLSMNDFLYIKVWVCSSVHLDVNWWSWVFSWCCTISNRGRQSGCELPDKFMRRRSSVQTQLSTDESTHKHRISTFVSYYNDPHPSTHAHSQPFPLKLLHRFPTFTFPNHEIWLNWMWDHGSYKEPINTGQMCFVEILQDIILMIYEFMGAKSLFWLSDWKATMYASHTHTKYNEQYRGFRWESTYPLCLIKWSLKNKGVHFDVQTYSVKHLRWLVHNSEVQTQSAPCCCYCASFLFSFQEEERQKTPKLHQIGSETLKKKSSFLSVSSVTNLRGAPQSAQSTAGK